MKEKSITLNELSKNLSVITGTDEILIKSFLSNLKNELVFYILDGYKISIPGVLSIHSGKSIVNKRYDIKSKSFVKLKPRRKLRCKISRSIQNEIILFDEAKKNTRT